MHRITLIPGDGTGPEITEATLTVLEATGVEIEWVVKEAGEKVMEKEGTPLPDEVIESIKDTKIALKGPITTPVGTGFRSVNVAIRQALDLYANLRPAKKLKGVKTPFEDVDIIVVRENTEGLYAGIEFEEGKPETKQFIETVSKLAGKQIREDSGISLKPISRFASRRIVKFAFEYAKNNNRKKVSAVHKANIMKFSDGLFLEEARKVAQEYPEIEFEEVIVDNMAMQLVKNPQKYDVLVMPNLYGDIISDLCSGLIGGLGLAPAGNIGDEYAVFEPVHGSAPKYAGLKKVNPTAMILSAALMLDFINEKKAAGAIRKAVEDVILEGKYVTYDLGGPASTFDMAKAIAERVPRYL